MKFVLQNMQRRRSYTPLNFPLRHTPFSTAHAQWQPMRPALGSKGQCMKFASIVCEFSSAPKSGAHAQ